MTETAHAAGEQVTQPGLLATLFPFVLLIAAIYFILIRPQQKRNKQHREMLTALKKGDEIVTIGGAIGEVIKISEDHVVVRLTDGVDVPFQKHAVQTVLPKGTVASI